MKQMIRWLCLIMMFILMPLHYALAANYYDYKIVDGNTAINSGGTLSQYLKFSLLIDGTDTIRALVQRYPDSNQKFDSGDIFLLFDSSVNSPSTRIDKKSTDNQYEIMLDSGIKKLSDMNPEWVDDKMKVFIRFDADDNNYTFAGPIIIQRTPLDDYGHLTVHLTPSEILNDAQWCLSDNCYPSGQKVELTPGSYNISFTTVDGWTAPCELRNVLIERDDGVGKILTFSYSSKICAAKVELIPSFARWRIWRTDKQEWSKWNNSKELFPGLVPGDTQIEFEAIPNWDFPFANKTKSFSVTCDKIDYLFASYCPQYPDPPVYLTATKGYTDKIVISWIRDNNFSDCNIVYDVYRNTINDANTAVRIVQNVDGDVYSDYDLIYDQNYWYWVKAKSVSGFTGDFSEPVQGNKKIKSAYDVTVTNPNSCENFVTWNHDEDPSHVKFELWRHGVFELKTARCIASNLVGTSFVDKDLFTGKQYVYWVVAQNSVSWSDSDNSWTQGVAKLPAPDDIIYSYCGLPPEGPWDKPWIEIKAPLLCDATGWVVKPVITARKELRTINSLPDFCGRDVCENGNCHFVDCSAPYGQEQEYTVALENDFATGPAVSIVGKACTPDATITKVSKGELIETIRIEWTFNFNTTGIVFDIMMSETKTPSASDWTYVDSTTVNFYEHSTLSGGYYCVKVRGEGSCPSVLTDNEYGYPQQCKFSITPEVGFTSLNAATGSFVINSQDNSKCRWDVRKDNTIPWITSVNPESGTGLQTISYSVSDIDSPQSGEIFVLDRNSQTVGTFTIQRTSKNKLQINNVGEGQVSVNGTTHTLPYEGEFSTDAQVDLIAIPAQDWIFDKWVRNDGITIANNTLSFTIDKITSFECHFKQQQVNLNISGSGNVRINGTETQTLPYSGQRNKGESISLTFLSTCPSGTVWNVNGVKTIQSSINVVMNADKAVSVSCLPTWGGTFTLNKGDSSSEQIKLGIANQASNIPASQTARLFFLEEDYTVDAYSEDIRLQPVSDEIVWYLAVDTANEEVSLEWDFADDCLDPNVSCQEFYYQLRAGSSSLGPVVISDLKTDSEPLIIKASDEIKYFTFHRSKVKFPTIISAVRGNSYPYVKITFGPEAILKEFPPDPPQQDCSIRILENNIESILPEGEEEYIVPLAVNLKITVADENLPVSVSVLWDYNSFDNRYPYYCITQVRESDECIAVENLREQKEFIVSGSTNADQFFNLYISKYDSSLPVCSPEIENNCPLFTKGSDITIENNAGPQVIQNWATDIDPGGENEQDQNLEFIIEYDNSLVLTEAPQISPDGTLTFEPVTGESGTSNVTVTLKDDGGLPGCDTSMQQHFSITVIQPCSTFVSLQIPDSYDTDLSTETIDLNKNQEFEIKVIFQSDQLKEILAFGLKFIFDSPLIEILEIIPGDIFGQNQTIVAENLIDPSGSAGFALASMSSVNVDSGVFCTLRCKTRSSSGKACITLDSVDLSDAAATPIAHCVKNQCVEIAYPKLYTDLSTYSVGTGTAFSSSHAITLIDGCVGAEMKILYNPTYLEPTLVEDGPFFGENGELISVKKEIVVDIDGKPTGEILWAAAYMGDTPPQGGGVLVNIDWKVSESITSSEPVSTTIAVANAAFADKDGNSIPVKIQKAAEVLIEPCRKTDLNCDGLVNIFDIVLAISCYNMDTSCDCWLNIIDPKTIPCVKADMNGDGKVNIFDIVILIGDYGWKKDDDPGKEVGSSFTRKQTLQVSLPEVAIGETVYIDMTVEDVINLIAYEIILIYNNQAFEYVDVSQGTNNMLVNTGRQIASIKPIVDQENGKIVFAMASIGDLPGAYGNGKIATFAFRRIAAGPYNFFLSNLELLQPNAVPNTIKVLGPFTILANPDDEISNVFVYRENGAMNISFENAIDNEDDATFHISRRDNTEDSQFEKITDTPLNPNQDEKISFVDSNVEASKTYFYRIEKFKDGEVDFISKVYEEGDPPPPDDEEKIAGDLTGDGKVDLADVIYLLQILAGFHNESMNQ
ncbi:MAG: hypothetical protein HQK75_05555 [Candidatus Magnetomorum sp.]|nr:hypothetical protein [Candidatus Magnetomorum sp.]